ncbi:hypothetical protein IW967_02115 [Alicyclobacillus mali]|uniref:Colicin V production protein n=1 Tax=Alicyclobacillus mali (ex Roth et al. 2021) TaxID=1123961 RepID=A0ABS0F064_9BACL|nr:hypothetical protein [Alicyclobacillus mali (ex Roth et al. 2021)]MBF8376672.1 hypothetical protein [Alicyclobacillus mali (ex Roth et al. 2021)]
MVDLVLLAGALWIAAWIATLPAEIALLYAAGFYASTYAAVQVAPWLVVHLSVTRPVLTWVAQRIETKVPVFDPYRPDDSSLVLPSPIAMHALDWMMAVFLGGAVWFTFVGVHRFLHIMLDENDSERATPLVRVASTLLGTATGAWCMLIAAPAIAALLDMFGHPQSFASNPLLDALLRGVQAIPVFRTMV